MSVEIIATTKNGFTLKRDFEYKVDVPKNCEGIAFLVLSHRSDPFDREVEYEVLTLSDIYSSAQPSRIAWNQSREAARYFSDVLNGRSTEFKEISKHGNITLKQAESDGRFVVDQPKKYEEFFFVKIIEDCENRNTTLTVLVDINDAHFSTEQFSRLAQHAEALAQAVDEFEKEINNRH